MKTSEIEAYFKAAAISNKKLKHEFTPDRKTFRRMNINEILNDQKTNLKDISMLLETPRRRAMDALSDNPRKLIVVPFFIIKWVKNDDFDGETAAMDETELITDQILAKIRNDVSKHKIDAAYAWKVKGFDLNTVSTVPVRNLFDGWIGWRTEITLNQTYVNNLVLKNDDWLNDTVFTI